MSFRHILFAAFRAQSLSLGTGRLLLKHIHSYFKIILLNIRHVLSISLFNMYFFLFYFS